MMNKKEDRPLGNEVKFKTVKKNTKYFQGLEYRELDKKFAFEPSVYIDAEQKVSENLSLSYGLRYSMFYRLGNSTVNIYDNNILLLATQFLSPTAPLAPQFYRYVIIDTTVYKGIKCVNLGFSPRNTNDQLFQGTLLVALDSTYAIDGSVRYYGNWDAVHKSGVKTSVNFYGTYEFNKDNKVVSGSEFFDVGGMMNAITPKK